LSEAVISALLGDFSKHGEKAIAKVRRTQPAAYEGALLVPGPTDEQLDAALDALREITRGVRRRGGENVIKGTAEPLALPAPEAQSREATPEPKRKSNRLMREADTAVGARERKPSRR
jgi:hypothetical protein